MMSIGPITLIERGELCGLSAEELKEKYDITKSNKAKIIETTNVIYLAAPYTSDDAEVVTGRMEYVSESAAKLLDMGYSVFSPLDHCHYALRHKVASPVDWVRQIDLRLMRACHAVLILGLPGWQASSGLRHEIIYATQRSIPVFFIDVPTLNEEYKLWRDSVEN